MYLSTVVVVVILPVRNAGNCGSPATVWVVVGFRTYQAVGKGDYLLDNFYLSHLTIGHCNIISDDS